MRLILLFAVFVILGLAFESAGARIVSVRALIPNLIIILAVDLACAIRRPTRDPGLYDGLCDRRNSRLPQA